MGLPLKVATRDVSGKLEYGRRYPMTELQDVVIITPGNMVIVLDSRGVDGEEEPLAFMNLLDLNMLESEMKDLKSLNHEKAMDYLISNPIFEDAYGAKERKQPIALNYQYCGINSRDQDHALSALMGKCALKITSKYDGISPGWSKESLVKDIAENMKKLTHIAQSMAAVAGMETRPFSDRHSSEHFASKIHPGNHLTGYTGTVTPVNPDNDLCAHIDRNNSSKKESNQVIGSYFYKLLNKDATIQLYHVYCGGRSMEICGKMASDAAKIGRLCNDLIAFINELQYFGILRTALLPEYTFSGPSSGKIYALFSTVAFTFNKI
jgi:hypothetical protein